MSLKTIFTSLIILLLATKGYAQTVNPPTTTFNINSPSTFTGGSSVTLSNQLSYYSVASLLLTLQVKASGDLIGSNGKTIPISDFKLQTTAITGNVTLTGSNNLITLSTANQNLSTGINLSALSTVNFSFAYTASGGNDFMLPAGDYTTTVTYTLTNLVLFSVSAPITLKVTISDVGAITLSGSTTATLTFSSANDYKNGVSLTQPAAINVFSNRNYAISVSSGGPNLTSGSTSDVISVGNVSVLPAASPANGAVTTTPAALSGTPQTIVSSSASTASQNYDLKYYTPAATVGNFLNKKAGTYSTTLTYTITQP